MKSPTGIPVERRAWPLTVRTQRAHRRRFTASHWTDNSTWPSLHALSSPELR